METWRPIRIEGYEGCYSASNLGRVRRDMPAESARAHNTKVGRLLALTPDRRGYLRVTLCRNTKRKSLSVHQLVASAFIGECPKGWTVNHKNNDKTNNTPENLEYMTRSDNCKDAWSKGWMVAAQSGSLNSNSKLESKQILRIRKLLASGARQMHVASEFGISRSTVQLIHYGKRYANV